MKVFSLLILINSSLAFGAIAPITLKLPEALKQGLEYNPDIKKANSSVKESEATLSKTRALLFPTINGVASATTRQNSSTFTSGGASANGGAAGETYSTGLTVSQPLYAGGAISAGLSSYKTSAESARQTYFSTKQDIALKIITSFLNLSQNQLLLDAGTQNRNILKSYADITVHYEKIGRSRKMDRMQAAVNYSMSLAELELTSYQMKVSQADLKNLLGILDDAMIQTAFTVTITPIEKMSAEQAFKSAQKNNPSVRIGQLGVEIVDYNKDVDLATDFPTLNLTGSFGYQSPDRGSLFNSTSQTYAIGLNLTVPIFSGLSSFAKRSIYGEKLYQAKYNLQIIENNLRSNIETALNALQGSKTQLEIAQTAIKEARAALDLANKAYQQGVASSLDVVNLQKTRYESEKLLVNSQYSYLKNLLALRQLMGIDLEKTYGH